MNTFLKIAGVCVLGALAYVWFIRKPTTTKSEYQKFVDSLRARATVTIKPAPEVTMPAQVTEFNKDLIAAS